MKKIRKFPIKKMIVDIEALGGEIELTELTQRYKVDCNDDADFDTPTNGVINAGLTQEQVELLGQNVLNELYEAVIDLTYPNVREQIKKDLEAGIHIPPTEEEVELSKKNI